MDVGIIGVGLMGHGIARNILARGGFKLSFLNHPGNQPVDELIELGATSCQSAADIAASSDVILLCVTGSPQVEAVLTGDSGLLSALRAGSIIVDCSTALPESTLRMAELIKMTGGHFIDAPMTRTAKHAHDGTLNLLVGGELDIIAKVRPILESFTENIKHVGSISSGHRLKLLHNYVSIGFMTLLAEAAALSADAGIEPGHFVDVLAAGGGAGAALERLSPYIVDGNRNCLPFAISNGLKDIEYYQTMAKAEKAQQTVVDGVCQAIRGAVDAGHGQDYLPELARIFRTQNT